MTRHWSDERETRREMYNRHNGILIGCRTCGHGFTSKRNLKAHDCAERQKWNIERGNNADGTTKRS